MAELAVAHIGAQEYAALGVPHGIASVDADARTTRHIVDNGQHAAEAGRAGETEVVGASWDGSVDIFASAALGNVVGNPLAPLLLREHGGLQSIAEVVGCRIGGQGGLAVGSNVEAPHGVDGGVLVA